MEAFFISTGLVTLAEIGDKTMLLALCLAAAWRRPGAILAGILLATLANHALAAALGAWVGNLLQGDWSRWLLSALFIGFALWALMPDQFENAAQAPKRRWASVFWATTVAFFLVEMGDKTQIATAALAAQFHQIAAVVAGSTLGMMIANAPAVLLGEALATSVDLKWVRWAASAAFAATGLWIAVFG